MTILSLCLNSDDGSVPNFPSRTDNVIDDIYFTPHNVRAALKNLSNKHSSGPDGLPPIFINAVADAIVEPLCTIFSLSFYTGSVPNDWSSANVTDRQTDKHLLSECT